MAQDFRRKLLAKVGIFVLSYLFWLSLVLAYQFAVFDPKYNTYPNLVRFSFIAALIWSVFPIWHLLIFNDLKKGARFSIALTWIAAIAFIYLTFSAPGPKESPGLILIPFIAAFLAIVVTVAIFVMTWLYSKMSRDADDKVD
jgi:hypothetical protein